MSYKALYRKYRPKNFNQVIGQDHIILTLKNIIKANKISHAYLFSGPRGIGKTSVAYIFANEINKKPEGNDIYSNMDFDIIEIDAASNNGVAEIRNLIDNSNYVPANSKYKVYIIDEIHMLTKGAFNALLKTLEEPPSHLVFILATTEPHKIPTTILSRIQRFNFKRIDDKLIIQQLKDILDKEKIIYETEAIKFVARLSQGGMRDALSIVDQAASYGNNKISFVAISQVFGIISIENQIKILNFTYQKKTKELLISIENFMDNGIDIEKLINSLIDIIKDYIIYKKTNDLNLCSILTNNNIVLLKISISFAYEAINELINILKHIKFSEMKKQIFMISLLKLTSFLEEKDINYKMENLSDKKQSKDIFETQNTFDNKIKESIDVNEIEISQKNILKNEQEKSKIQDIFLDEFDDDNQKLVVEVENEQEKLINQNIDEHITSTQDISLDEFDDDNQKLTEEIDLVSYFDFDKKEIKNNSLNKQIFDMSELINYLQHADFDKKNKFKRLLPNVVNWIDKTKNKNYITLIQKSILISAGEKFIIISSKEKEILDLLKLETKKQEFIDLMSSVLEEPVNTIAISKEEFREVKAEWEKLTLEKLFPKKYPIKDVTISKENKSDAKQFGEKLFENLFK